MSVEVLSAFLLIIAAVNAQKKLTVVVNPVVDKPLYEGKDATFACEYTVEADDDLQEVVWMYSGNKMFKMTNFDSGDAGVTIRQYASAPSERFSAVFDKKALMTIKGLLFKDEGQMVTCQVETTKAYNVSKAFELRVDAKPEMPTISSGDIKLSDLKEGDMVELSCTGTVGRPYNDHDALTWSFVDEQDMETPVTSDMTTFQTLQDNRGKATSSFRFNASVADNNGRYRCTLKNAVGDQQSIDSNAMKVRAIAKLTSDKMTVTVKLGSSQKEQTTFDEGERVDMMCNAADVYPEPSNYEWLFRKTANADNPNSMGNGKTYMIKSVSLNQAGVYECKAEQNNNGNYVTASKSVTIKVIKKAPVVDPNGGKNTGRVLAASMVVVTAALLATL